MTIVMRQFAGARPCAGSLLHRIDLTLANPPEDPLIEAASLRVLLEEVKARLEVTSRADSEALSLIIINLTDGVNYWHQRCIELQGG